MPKLIEIKRTQKKPFLKMLHLYIDTFIIGNKFCGMLSILNELTLQKELQNVMTNSVFRTKEIKITKKKQIKNNTENPCQNRESNPGTLAPQMRYH